MPDRHPGLLAVPRDVPLRTMLRAVAVVGGAWLLLHLLPVVLVVIVSLFLVGTLGPAVEWLESRGVSRGWGIAVAFTALALLTSGLVAITVPPLVDQVTNLVRQEPSIRDHLATALSRWRVSAPLAESLRDVRYEALARTLASAALKYSSAALEIVAYVVSAVFLAMYMMIDRDRLRGGLFAVVPRTHHIRLSRVLINLETIVGGYIRGQVLTSVFMGLFVFGLLTVCHIPNAIALAVFAGLADVLPYVGVFLSVGPAVLAALPAGLATTLVVLVAMIAYEEFESRFLVPRIYGRALRLPSSIVMVALLAGGTLMGIVGALLALPVAAAIRMLVDELRVELPGEVQDDPRIHARDDRFEREYELRAEGIPAEQAAAIAVEMAEIRRETEGRPSVDPTRDTSHD
ncbi:MAG TPA: AI-2E family transporter [Polyangiaceae bacterium]|jgi:predicted PurR-regulated permease PerM|nr:AI-2E family transporter [Polyangiaceae bacterium]